jgi:heme/copper-type cytochrome/quinol oxidase subunit 4
LAILAAKNKEAGAMLAKLARGLFLAVIVTLIAVYAVSAATSSPSPTAPSDNAIEWC